MSEEYNELLEQIKNKISDLEKENERLEKERIRQGKIIIDLHEELHRQEVAYKLTIKKDCEYQSKYSNINKIADIIFKRFINYLQEENKLLKEKATQL